MIPDRIGPYQIETKLGAGGMGTVYHAIDDRNGREVALKVLPPALSREEGFVRRFHREFETLRTLSSPHIVEFYEAGSDDETHYFAMEYVRGETLTERIRKQRRLPWREAIEIARQTAVALKTAHDAGVIHRDLKPSNLLIREGDDCVKLTDFGVAQVFAGTRLTSTGGVIGTAEYMAPEQARGAKATKRSDLYSLGTVLYAMLVGRPPFTGETAIDVMHKQQYSRFDHPNHFAPEIPIWLNDLVCETLEKEPDKRPPDAYVLSRRLAEIPKKVELSRGADSVGSSVTAPGASTVPQATGDDALGGATLMRDLFRAQVETDRRKSPVGRFFDNIWVLLTLLGLLIAGGIWWFNRDADPERRFEIAMAMMDESEGSGWIEAKEDYFLPLLEEDPERFAERVEPELERIRQYELKRHLTRTETDRRGQIVPRNEAEQLLFRAKRQIDAGQELAAERTLEAAVVLLVGREDWLPLASIAQEMLIGLREQRQRQVESGSAAEFGLERAETLIEEDRVTDAREVWEAIVFLYGNDPIAAEAVATARRRLDETRPVTDDSPLTEPTP